jgi:IS30 family transposase
MYHLDNLYYFYRKKTLLNMDKTTNLRQLIDHTKQLMYSNEQLVKANNNYFHLIEQLNERQEKILKCFGKLYRFINSKKEKTWEEHNLVNELYDLITHSEKDRIA